MLLARVVVQHAWLLKQCRGRATGLGCRQSKRKNLVAAVGDEQNMFILNRAQAIDRDGSPPVAQNPHTRPAFVDDRLDHKDHASFHGATAGVGKVQNIWEFVEVSANAVAQELHADGEPALLDMLLNQHAEQGQSHTRTACADRQIPALSCHLHKREATCVDLADWEGFGIITVEAVEVYRDIYVDHIAVSQGPVVRDAMTGDVVDGGTHRFGKAAVVEWRWVGTCVHYEVVHTLVDLLGGDSGPY
jgi:hypothetical protein